MIKDIFFIKNTRFIFSRTALVKKSIIFNLIKLNKVLVFFFNNKTFMTS